MKNSSSLTAKLLACFLFSSCIVFSQEPVETNNDLAAKFASLINRPEICEAYPYLSGDGLRLYFTTDREGGFGRLYFCSRNSVTENFGAPEPLSLNLPDGYYAATLTADELTIYASYDGDIYSSNRQSLNDQFSKPAILKDLIEGKKFAPAISPDGNELIIISSHYRKDGDVAMHYRKNAAGIFAEVNVLPVPGDIVIHPGQFSKDGLSFYISWDLPNSAVEPRKKKKAAEQLHTQKIMRFTRKTPAENFTAFAEVSELNLSIRNHHPTMNQDETIFIIANSSEDLWSKNELRLIDFNQVVELTACKLEEEVLKVDTVPTGKAILWDRILDHIRKTSDTVDCDLSDVHFGCGFDIEEIALPGTIFETKKNISIEVTEIIPISKVYPNPFTNSITVTLEKNNLNTRFDLYDISGRKILTTKLNSVSNRIQFNQPGSGIYIYKLTDETGKAIASGELVKR